MVLSLFSWYLLSILILAIGKKSSQYHKSDIMRICLFSGPGCGKSTLATWLFSQIKMQRPTIKVELVSEYIKDWAWDKRVPKSWDQFYVFAKQLNREDKVLRHDVHVITDSPLLMQLGYIERGGSVFAEECLSACRKFEEKYPSVNILLERVVEYVPEGRYENLQQAKEMDERITQLLSRALGAYMRFSPLDKETILEYVLKRLDHEQSKAA